MAKTKASKISTRIEALRAVIEKECTAPKCRETGKCGHEGEKEAARHMLGRLLEKLKDAASDEQEERAQMWADIYERGYDSHGNTFFQGSKYRSGQSMKDRAAGIRMDIKVARKAGQTPLVQDGPGLVSQALETYRFDPIGEAPAEIKFGVRIGRGYGSIYIDIKSIPQDWGWIAEEVTDYQGEKVTRWHRSRALKDLEAELKAVGEAYNADHGSNIMTDCFAKAFYVFVEYDDPATLEWRAEYERKRRGARA
ncbi:hypothetical protein [Streptomyces sp. NPDC006012]|uniref:hypothetical protein n=1 Tax=Streptomyces sp. NPDC006012 TaxID=3364739 RepID=UPI0036BA6393